MTKNPTTKKIKAIFAGSEKNRVERIKQVYESNLETKARLQKEADELKVKMEDAEKRLDEKRRQLLQEGLLPSGGYIVTGEEEEGFLDLMNENDEYLEEQYLGEERKQLSEAKGDYHEKLLQLISFESEVVASKYAYEAALAENEPNENV